MNWIGHGEFNNLQNDILVARERNYSVRRRGHKDLYKRIDLATEWMSNDPDYVDFNLNDIQKRESIVIGITPNNKVKCNFCGSIIVPDHRGRFHGFCNHQCINRNKYHLETPGSRYNELFKEDYYEIFRKFRFDYEEIVNYFGVSPQLVQKRYWDLGLRTWGSQTSVLLAREKIFKLYGLPDIPTNFHYHLQTIYDKECLYDIWESFNFNVGNMSDWLGVESNLIRSDIKWFGYTLSNNMTHQAYKVYNDRDFAAQVYNAFHEDIVGMANFLRVESSNLKSYLLRSGVKAKSLGGWAGQSIAKRDSTVGYVYIFSIYNNKESFYKIGVSNNPEKRLREVINSSEGHYLGDIKYLKKMDKWKCFIAEKYLLDKIGSIKYKPSKYFVGSSECIHSAFLNRTIKVLDYMYSNFDYEKSAITRSYLYDGMKNDC